MKTLEEIVKTLKGKTVTEAEKEITDVGGNAVVVHNKDTGKKLAVSMNLKTSRVRIVQNAGVVESAVIG